MIYIFYGISPGDYSSTSHPLGRYSIATLMGDNLLVNKFDIAQASNYDIIIAS